MNVQTTTSTARVVGYARISLDGDGRGLGVERQREDILRLAAVLDLPLTDADIIVENETSKGDGKPIKASASQYATKPRAKFDDMVARVRSGEITTVLSYSMSRLTRDMIEREHLLALRKSGATIQTAQGQRIHPDMTSDEVDVIRYIGVGDTSYSDKISGLTRRAFDQNAAAGTPHGPIAYGWDRHHEKDGTVVDTINEAQAGVVREAAARLLAGETLAGVARDLTAREVPAPRGGSWSATILRKLVLRERNAARRVHRGVVVGPAAWQPILDDDTFAAVVATVADPARKTGSRRTGEHLLSGLMTCSKCGGERVWSWFPKGDAVSYACRQCHGLSRKQETLDAYVSDAVCAYMAKPGALDWAATDQGALRAARARLVGLEAREAELGDAFADGLMTMAQVARANATLVPELEAARAAVELARPLPTAVRDLAELDSLEEIETFWQRLPLDSQRAVIKTVVDITLLPSSRRRGFDPEGVRLDFRS